MIVQVILVTRSSRSSGHHGHQVIMITTESSWFRCSPFWCPGCCTVPPPHGFSGSRFQGSPGNFCSQICSHLRCVLKRFLFDRGISCANIYLWSLFLILILMFTFLVLSCRASRSWCMRIGITTLTFLWDYEKYQAVFGFVFFNFLWDIEKYQVVFGFVSFNFLWDFEKYHVVFAFVFAEYLPTDSSFCR